VQILINLEHFEIACQELELLLVAARSAASTGGSITLNATEEFRSNKKTAEKRIFELVNSKIDDLIETAEYDWYVHLSYIQSLHATCDFRFLVVKLSALKQDGTGSRNGTQQLHANTNAVPVKYHEFSAVGATNRN